jgi:hypothetical protein
MSANPTASTAAGVAAEPGAVVGARRPGPTYSSRAAIPVHGSQVHTLENREQV